MVEAFYNPSNLTFQVTKLTSDGKADKGKKNETTGHLPRLTSLLKRKSEKKIYKTKLSLKTC